MADANNPWSYSTQLGRRFIYHASSDRIMFDDGVWRPRPQDIPKDILTATTDQRAADRIPRSFPAYSSVEQHSRPVSWTPTYVYQPSQPPQQHFDNSAALISGQEQPQRPDMQALTGYHHALSSASSSGSVVPAFQSLSVSPPRRRGSYHVSATRTRRTPHGNERENYSTVAILLRSSRELPEGLSEPEATLYSHFRRVTQYRKFFVVGKVFMTLWAEPAGDQDSNHTAITSGISIGQYGERVFSKIRRFVVVRASNRSCTALPILTYEGRGVSKEGVIKSEHAVIYTGRTVPTVEPSELPVRDELGLLPQAIRVDPDSLDFALDPLSRVNFGKYYTIEYNVKVCSWGKVNRTSESALSYQLKNVWDRTIGESSLHPQAQEHGSLYPVSRPPSASAPQAEIARAYKVLLSSGDFTSEEALAVLKDLQPHNVQRLRTGDWRFDERNEGSSGDEADDSD